ncbi:hypothetical protein D3C78_1637530 [compost metagenome]
MATQLIAVLFDGVAIQAVDRHHHQLDAAALLEGSQLLGELMRLLARHQARLVHHPAAEGRKRGGRLQCRRPQQQAGQQPADH